MPITTKPLVLRFAGTVEAGGQRRPGTGADRKVLAGWLYALQCPNTMESEDLFIHINWDGPFSLEAVSKLNTPADKGIYQIYGAHPVYGSDVLLYIGLAADRTFAVRLAEHMWCRNNQDAGRVEVYVGRLWGTKTPDNATWSRQIVLAERLLIYAHVPAENTQKELKKLEPELRRVHVINWHRYRDLMREVSGAGWADCFADLNSYRHFGAVDQVARPTESQPT